MPDEPYGAQEYDARYERGVLGQALWGPEGLEKLASQARRNDFFLTVHQNLFDYLLSAVENGGMSLTRAAADLATEATLTEYGGIAYLDQLHDEAVPLSGMDHFLRKLRGHSNARSLSSLGGQLASLGHATQGDSDKVAAALADAQEKIWALADDTTDKGYAPLGPAIQEAYNKATSEEQDEERIPTGFMDLDRMLNGGVIPGQVVVVAARPGMGKSALALDCCRYTAVKRGETALYVSLEMPAIEHARRALSAEADVPLQHLIEQSVSEDDKRRIDKHMDNLLEAPLYITDASSLTPMEISTQIRALKRRANLKLVVVDYLQLMSPDKASDSRQQEISEISRQFKALAKRENVGIILVAQLNRGPEQRSDKRPQTSDLRESGQIEQDADIIIFVFRPECYEPDDPDVAGIAELLLAKHRNGKTGTVKLVFFGHSTSFRDMAEEDVPA